MTNSSQRHRRTLQMLRRGKCLLCIKMALLLPSISLSSVDRCLSRCSFLPRVAISSCCVLNSPRGACMYIALARKRNSLRLSAAAAAAAGMYSRRLRGMQRPISATNDCCSTQRLKSCTRRNNLRFKVLRELSCVAHLTWRNSNVNSRCQIASENCQVFRSVRVDGITRIYRATGLRNCRATNGKAKTDSLFKAEVSSTYCVSIH